MDTGDSGVYADDMDHTEIHKDWEEKLDKY
jgi:hypothetical protein